MAGVARVGISGWRYAPWRGDFYPKGLAQRRELEFASRQLGSIELNGSFYSLQRPESYVAWRDETPSDFVFAVKGGRFVTHMLRLRGVEAALANFFAYARLHGDTELYASGYDDVALDRWAATVQGWLDSGRDAYVYFDNDMKVRAPYDAMALAARLGVGPIAVETNP